MKKENGHLRFIRTFYDIRGDLDEYSLQEINNFGNHMYMLIYAAALLSLLSTLLGFEDLGTDILTLGFIIPLIKQASLIKRLGLHQLEITADELGTARKRMLKRSLLETGVILLAVILTSLSLWRMGLPQESGTSFETFWYFSVPIASLLIGSLAFTSFVLTNRRRIIIVKE